MKLKTLMAVKSIICLVFGVGFIAGPISLASFYGMTLGSGGIIMARLFGQAFILISIFLWLARIATESDALKAVAISVCVGDIVGFVITLFAVLSGSMNAMGWISVALYLLLALGFGLNIKKPASA